MAIENLMNSQKTALLRPRVLQEARVTKDFKMAVAPALSGALLKMKRTRWARTGALSEPPFSASIRVRTVALY